MTLNLPLALSIGPEEPISLESVMARSFTPLFVDIWLKVGVTRQMVTSNVNRIVNRGAIKSVKWTCLEQNVKKRFILLKPIFNKQIFLVSNYFAQFTVRNIYIEIIMTFLIQLKDRRDALTTAERMAEDTQRGSECSKEGSENLGS